MKVLQAVYRFIDERENGWTWIYFHILPVGFCTWFFLTLDYTSFAALGLSLLLPKSVVPLTLFCMAYFYQTGYMYYNSLYSKYWSMINPNTFIWVKDGVPGSGKSSSALVYAYIMSQKVWRDLRRKYWLYKNNPKRLFKDKVSAANWQDIQSAYLFWARHPEAIPCLMSNIALEDRGRKTMQLTKQHFLQEKRIPYGTVLYGDELDKLFPALASQTKEEREGLEPLRQLAGFTRHFGDFRWVYTTQQSEKVWTGVRDSVAINEYMYSQEWVCRPALFLEIYDFIMRRVEKRSFPPSKFLARFMWGFNDLIRKIGFRHYRSEMGGNMQRENVKLKSETVEYAAPSRLPLEYDDRTFRNSYKAKIMALEDNRIFDSLIAPPIMT